jgi:hypothetical protein
MKTEEVEGWRHFGRLACATADAVEIMRITRLWVLLFPANSASFSRLSLHDCDEQQACNCQLPVVFGRCYLTHCTRVVRNLAVSRGTSFPSAISITLTKNVAFSFHHPCRSEAADETSAGAPAGERSKYVTNLAHHHANGQHKLCRNLLASFAVQLNAVRQPRCCVVPVHWSENHGVLGSEAPWCSGSRCALVC